MPAKLPSVLITLLLIPVFIVFSQCRASSANGQEQISARESIVIEKLGKDLTSEENSSKTLILYQQKRSQDHIGRKIKYLVMRKSDREIVREGEFQNGYVKWNDDASLAVLTAASPTAEGELKIIRLTNQ